MCNRFKFLFIMNIYQEKRCTMYAKVIKCKIVASVSLKWEEFRPHFYQLQRETRSILNRTIQLCWEYDQFSSAYKESYGVYPSAKEMFSKTLGGFLYSELSNQTQVLNTDNMGQSLQMAQARWKTDKKEVYLGKKSTEHLDGEHAFDIMNDDNRSNKSRLAQRILSPSSGAKSERNIENT